MKLNLTPKQRKLIYIGAGATLSALAVFNVIDSNSVPTYLDIIGSLLGTGSLAVAHANVVVE